MKTKPAHATLDHVPQFIDWLSLELNCDKPFKHEYIDRRTGTKWSCDTLYGAYESYTWNHPGNSRLSFNPGVSSDSNSNALEALRRDLLAADCNDDLVLQGALEVMAWGGVTARNAQWLIANKYGLGRMVQDVKAALVKKDPDAPVLRSPALRFNSGMTKIYSLICPDFVIYDSRVAAGLGKLVVNYCKEKGLTKVPEGLNFPWAAAKEGENSVSPKNRNPSTGTLQFKRLRSGSHHAYWNMNASWILSQVSRHVLSAASPFRVGKTPAQTLRAIEQALFMVGYDLGTVAD